LWYTWFGVNKTVGLASLVLIFALAGMWFLRDRHLTDSPPSACGDPEGPRPKIDLRQFETNYIGYSISLEGEITGRGKLSGKIEPAALQKLSDSLQSGQEFRKALVAGYNSCAVTRFAYQAAVLRFQSLDGIARRIDTLFNKASLTPEEERTLAMLVDEYSSISQHLGESTK
jgi:hypothetical protein